MLGESCGLIGGYTQIKIHIPSDDEIRGVISTLNDSCRLRSFQEVMPSMNDIFIRAVENRL